MERLNSAEYDSASNEESDDGWGEVAALADKRDFSEAPSNHADFDDEDEDSYEYDDDGYEDYDDDYDSYYHDGDERLDVKEDELKIHEIPLPESILRRYDFIEKLPSSIAVMGGVARSIAREVLTGDRELIRDIDLVEITGDDGESMVDPDLLDELSRTYMSDDYSFGHGIGQDTVDHYFSTRDFTINQCLIKDSKLLVSDLAENDFKENIIRPTYHELPYTGSLSSRLFLKALMMRTVISQISESIPLLEDVEVDQHYYVGDFNLAVFLNKAMSRGAETAIGFVNDLVEWEIVDVAYVGRPVELAKDLANNLDHFTFRPSTDERFQDIDESRDMSGFFVPKAMREYHASDPVIAKAMAEYDDIGPGREEDEPSSGYYTQKHYDAINSCAKSHKRY